MKKPTGKRLTKWVVQTMIILLALSLAACSGQTNVVSNPTPTPKASAESSTPAPEESKPKNSLVSEKETTLTVLMAEHASYPVKSYEDSPFLQHIKEKTNVKLDLMVVPDAGDAYKQKLNIMLNGNDLPDIIWSSSSDDTINSLAVRGMFLAYTDYLHIAPNLKKVLDENPQILKSFSAQDSKLYIMPRMTLNTMTEVYIAREDILQKENLQQPSNYDELYSVLKTLKEKFPDKAIFINRNGTQHLVNRLGYSWGTGYEPTTHGFYMNKDLDKFVYGPAEENFKSMVLWLKKLYDEKILDADYALMSTKQWEEAFANENALFTIDFIARVQMINSAYIGSGSTSRVVAISPPAGPTGKRGIVGRYPAMTNSGIVISAKAKEPEVAVKFVDWVYSDEGRYIATYGIEGETFTIGADGRPSLTPQMKRQANPTGKELVKDYGWVYYMNKYEFPEGFLKPLDTDSVPEDDRYMHSRSVMESINAVIEPDPVLHYTDEQARILKNKGTDISDYFNQNIDKFIMGTRPIQEWDQFVNEIKQLGVAEVEKVLNDAYASYKAK